MDNLQLLDDIQQLLDSRISQSEQRIIKELDGLRIEMREGFQGIADIITDHNDRLDNHKDRILVLETKTV